MNFGDFLDERGISNEEAAALLGEHGIVLTAGARVGEAVTEKDIARRRRQGRPMPKIWQRAFGVEDSEPITPEPGSDEPPSAGTDGQRARREAPPRRPREARIEIVEPGARKRIAGAYKFAGAALAAGAGSNGVAEVWADQADPIAELWIAAAQDNPWAARFVNMMSAGGAGGDLAAAHLYLVGATFYVLGAGIPGGDAIFAKYSRHRPPAVPKPEPKQNGTQPDGDAAPAEGAVVDGLG